MNRPLFMLLASLMMVLVVPVSQASGGGGADSLYLPLSAENAWHYVYPGLPHIPPSRHAIGDSISINDTLYYVIDFPVLPWDTLRVADDGAVWMRHLGRDELLLDVHAPDGASYRVPTSIDPDLDLAYVVTVSRSVDVEVAAGRFSDAMRFSFDVPEVMDAGQYLTVVAGVGPVSIGSAWDHRELWLAEIGEASHPPTDATIPDTLDWRGYFPLEVGNVWEYRYESQFDPGYIRWEITGDSIADGRSGYSVVITDLDHSAHPIHEGRQFWHYDEQTQGAATAKTQPGCNLGTPFPVPQHQGVRIEIDSCGEIGEILLYGEYTEGELVVGVDTLPYPAWKRFEDVAGGFAVYHGIGLPGWAVEGSASSVHLIYARLGGVEYGESAISTSAERPGAPPDRDLALSLYPNPFFDHLTIEYSGRIAGNVTFEVFDVLGRRVQSGELKGTRVGVDARGLGAGLYLVRVRDGSRIQATQAVVKLNTPE